METLRGWEQAWGANDALEGEGRRIAPVLTAERGGRAPFGWTIPIEGPKALIARCMPAHRSPAGIARRWRQALEEIEAHEPHPPALRFTLANTLKEEGGASEDPKHIEVWRLGAPIREMDEALGHCA